MVLRGGTVSYERGTPEPGEFVPGAALDGRRGQRAGLAPEGLPRQSLGGGEFIQQRLERRSPLLKTNVLMGN